MERGSITARFRDMLLQAGYAEEEFRIFQQHSVLLRLLPLVVKAFDTLGYERVENPVLPLGIEIKNDRFGMFKGIGMMYLLQPHAVAWTVAANTMERDEVLFYWCHELAHALQPEAFFLENASLDVDVKGIDQYIGNPIEAQANKAALMIAHNFNLSKDELEKEYAEFCVRLKANYKAA